MPNLRYQRGASYERMIQKAFEAIEFTAVRSAASKGLFDVVAFPKPSSNCSTALLIQCKSLREKITADKWLHRPGVQKELKPFGDFVTTIPHSKILAVIQPGEPTPHKKGTPPLRVTLYYVYDFFTEGKKRRKFKRIEIEGVSK